MVVLLLIPFHTIFDPLVYNDIMNEIQYVCTKCAKILVSMPETALGAFVIGDKDGVTDDVSSSMKCEICKAPLEKKTVPVNQDGCCGGGCEK